MQQTVQNPKDASQLAALRARRDELENQLDALTDRRQRLVNERANAASFSGNEGIVGELDAQIKELSARLRRIDADKLAMDDAISAALRQGVSEEGGVRVISVSPPPPPGVSEQLIGVPESPESGPLQGRYERMMLFEALVFVLLAPVLWRWGVRRGRREAVSSGQNDQQLRQAVDAIAIEVERISENQRYVTKLLAEQNQAAGASRPASDAERPARGAR